MRSSAMTLLRVFCRLICFLPAMAAAEALACTPGPYRYDTAEDSSTVIATARVLHYEMTTESGKSCIRTSYVVDEVLSGSFEGPLEASVCSSGKGGADGMEELGFKAGAFVLVGLTKSPFPDGMGLEWDSNYRYFYPSCWGPLHYNLDKLPEAERRELIDAARSLRLERAQE